MIDEARLVAEFCEYVAIDAPTFFEKELADLVWQRLDELGLELSQDGAGALIGGNCNNVYATWPGTRPDLEPILFCAHFDTVEPSRGKQAILTGDGRITSAGDTVLGADNLSGLTAIMEALRSIKEDNVPHRTVQLLLTVAEEQHLLGSRHLEPHRIKARQAYTLDAEGPPGTAISRAPGNIGFKFKVSGQPAHAGMAPEKGISAITAAARGIAAMPLGRIDHETTANIGRISGGGETNIVAADCTVTAECRSQDMAKMQAQADSMRSCMEEAAASLGAGLEIEQTLAYQPYAVPANSKALHRFQQACSQLGFAGNQEPGGGGSDNNTLVLHGIDGIVLTCGMRKVHTLEEEIYISDLVNTARLVEALILLP